jgi:hypothetical protein
MRPRDGAGREVPIVRLPITLSDASSTPSDELCVLQAGSEGAQRYDAATSDAAPRGGITSTKE